MLSLCFFSCFAQAFLKEFFLDPNLDVKNVCTKHVKIQMKDTNNTPHEMK